MVRSDLETCYTIASDWNTEASVNVGRFQVDFHLKSQVWPRSLARFWITSEDNSYGLVWSRWFDGTTTKGPILYKDEAYVFTIEEVREFQNLKSTCSENSYYKCLANRFRKFDFDNALGFTDKDGGKCHFEKLCSPFTLPFDDNTIPLCKTEQDIYCFQAVLNNLRLDQQKHCPRSCHMREYKLEETAWSKHENTNQSTLGLKFGVPSQTRAL